MTIRVFQRNWRRNGKYSINDVGNPGVAGVLRHVSVRHPGMDVITTMGHNL